jgi:hypothetical protein
VRGGPAAALVFVAIGLAVIGRTVQVGVGGGLGLVVGSLFLVAGGLRLYRSRRS